MVLDTFDAKAVKQRLIEVDLDVCTSTVLLETHDITSDDPKVRERGIQYLKDCVDATYQIGAKNLSGVIYSQHVKPVNNRPTEETWQRSAECLKIVAKYAQQFGVQIGIEPVNRY